MQELSSIGLMPEDWGGNTPMVPVCISYLSLSFSFPVYISLTLKKLYFSPVLLCQQISALKGTNVDDLLETVMLVAEVSLLLVS